MSFEMPLRIAVIGAGYFAPFHVDAWRRIPEAVVVAICDIDPAKAVCLVVSDVAMHVYSDWQEMLSLERPTVVDVVSPPTTHRAICLAAAEMGIHVVCQKPLTPTFEESTSLVREMAIKSSRFMIHENWRWQPWYREIKRLLVTGEIGMPTHLHILTRLGDGWGTMPYSPRQTFFRHYPKFLLFETGIHFFDTFRFLFGEVESVFASIRKTNPLIAGEDAALVHLRFRNGVTATWDASRYAESDAANPRITFGEIRLDALQGSVSVHPDSTMTIKALGQPSLKIRLDFEPGTFAGDCVYYTQRHFVIQLLCGAPFESEGRDYLRSLAIVEGAYNSAQNGEVVYLDQEGMV